MSDRTHITTFYSYKGGVGRTMLLANTGAILARMGRKVLLWDLDVEALGMHLIPALRPEPPHEIGFLEWLRDMQAKRQPVIPDAKALEALSGLIQPVPNLKNLHILPAFGDRADSAGLYQDIRWQEFLVEKPETGLLLFRKILDHFSDTAEFDHILLDARTGITDLGGLMTAILPHAVILVGSYGSQNLSGLLQIDRALTLARQRKYAVARAPLPDLKRLLVISPVPKDQEKRLAARRKIWDVEFPALDSDSGMETRLEIPFDSRLLFIEDLLAIEDENSEIAAAYSKIAVKIDEFLEDLVSLPELIEKELAAFPDLVQRAGRLNRHENGKTFEEHVAKLLTLLGYKVEPEQLVDGNRVDLIAKQTSGLREECFLVECKEHGKPVGKDVLEKLAVWLNGDQARAMRAEGMVVAKSFSPAARTYAKANRILALTPEELERRLFDLGPYLARLKQDFEASELARTYVDQRVLLENHPDPNGADLLDHAKKWAAGEGTRLWLLLGDFGTGKTAFFKRFAYELAKHTDDPDMPVPIAVDLKLFPNAISMEGLLQEHLRAYVSWNGNPDILLHLLSSGRVVLLLDAFDEMGTAAVGRSVEEQFRQLLKPLSGMGDKKGNRILITCRTHFFKDQQNIKDMLYGAADDLVSRDSELGRLARAFDGTIDELMLFNDGQIRTYLNRRLSAIQARQAEKFIKDTYDLPSLAPRPVLLEMIVDSLPDLIKSKNGITPAGLYHIYTTRWLEDKSGGTLQTSAHLRKKILEHLAFDLWGRPLHRIHHRELLAVLEKLEPGMLAGIDPDRVDLELRTAAFLIRSREGYYTFSHKSFREFFFSRHILSSLKKGPDRFAEALNTVPVTPECIGFFCDLMEHGQDKKDRETVNFTELKNALKAILASPYRQFVSENALLLAYFCAGYRFNASNATPQPGTSLSDMMREFMPDVAQLHGAVLSETNLKGAWLEHADLSGADLEESDLSMIRATGADFSGALLKRARLEQADCGKTNFSRAVMREVKARQADFTGAIFENADLTAGVFVHTNCNHASFKSANCHAARFAGAGLKDADWADAVTTALTAPAAKPLPPGVGRLPSTLAPLFQVGHAGPVTSAAFSHDDRHALTASYDGTAALWDLGSRKLIRRFAGHDDRINSAAFSHDDKHILTASDDKTVALWGCGSGELIRRFIGHESEVFSAVFSNDGKYVLSASADNTAVLWDRESGELIRRFNGHKSMVKSAVFSNDGKYVLSASDDNTAALWNRESGELIRCFKGYESVVTSAVFSQNDKYVLTANAGKNAILWDRESGELIRRFNGHKSMVKSAVFSNDDKNILTASADNTAVLWDRESGEPIRRFKGHGSVVNSAVFSNDGKFVLTASNDCTAALWDSNDGRLICHLKKHEPWIESVEFSHDSKLVLTAGANWITTSWDIRTGELIRRFTEQKSRINSAVFSHDSKLVLTAGADRTATLWDHNSGESIRRFKGHSDEVRSAVFSNDGMRILTASADKTIALWDLNTGRIIRRFKGHEFGVYSAVFSHDDKRVLTASADNTSALWDINTGKLTRRFRGHELRVTSAVFSHDDRHVLTASADRTAALWVTNTGKLIRRFKGHDDGVTSAVFSHDEKHVLTASWDKTAALWNFNSGKLIRRFPGHDAGVRSAVFSHDDKQVLTASDDKTAALWDTGSAERLMTIAALPDGLIFLDAQNRYMAEENGLSRLTYYDPNEKTRFPTIWEAEDLPHMRVHDVGNLVK